MNVKKQFSDYIAESNTPGSNKADSYIRAIGYANTMLRDFWHSLGGVGASRQFVIVASQVHHEEGSVTTDDAKRWWEINNKKFSRNWGNNVMKLVCERNEELCKSFVGKVLRRCEAIVR